MKLQLQVGHVYQRAAKATDRTKPMPVEWDVLLFTEPHMGDVNLVSTDKAFADWAKTLSANQLVEIEFRVLPESKDQSDVQTKPTKT